MMNEHDESLISVIGRLAARLILLCLAALVLFVAASRAYRFGKDIFYQAPMEEEPGTDVEVRITDNMGYADLAELMELKGLIRNRDAFQIQARLYKTALVPGTYVLNTSMTSKELLTAVNEKARELKEAKEAETGDEISVVGGGDEEGASDGKQ